MGMGSMRLNNIVNIQPSFPNLTLQSIDESHNLHMQLQVVTMHKLTVAATGEVTVTVTVTLVVGV